MHPPANQAIALLLVEIDERDSTSSERAVTSGRVAARVEEIARAAVAAVGGRAVVSGSGVVEAVFAAADQGIAVAIEIQLAVEFEDWSAYELATPLRVRMALHAGSPEAGLLGDYRGPTLNRLQRLLDIGHPGQVLISDEVARRVVGSLPEDIELRDLGFHGLKDLLEPERVHQVVHPALTADFPPLRSLAANPHNLPVQLTPLIGRERELARAVAMVRDDGTRLLTLTGPGGMGKTRLGLQVAAELVDAFPDGVWFVPLAAVTDPSLVVMSIGDALGVRESGSGDVRELVLDHLRGKTALLLLDNFEHLLEASSIVTDLLTLPSISILVTSRSPLRLRAEREFPVPPLVLPKRKPPPTAEQLNQFAAVQLFIERAQAVKPDFVVTNENAPAIAEICYRLDGLPLAIELAAARVKLLPPEALLGRLEQRLSLLTGGARDLPKRQQTLREAIAWSYDLLGADEQRVFRMLGVFTGGFSLETADGIWNRLHTEASADETNGVVRSVLPEIAELVDESLVRQVEPVSSEARFDFFQTIQEFAREELNAHGERERARRAHLDVIADMARRAAPQLIGPDQVAWFRRLTSEHDNLRAALTYALSVGDGEMADAICGNIWRFWWVRGHLSEGRRWLEASIALRPDALTSEHGHAVKGAGSLAEDQGDIERAIERYAQAVQIARAIGDRYLEALTLDSQGNIEHDRGRYEESIPLHAEAQRIFEEIGDKRGAASAAHNLGSVRYYMGDLDAAEAAYTRSLDLIREAGDLRGVAIISGNLAAVIRARGDSERSLNVLDASLDVLRELGDEPGYALSLTNMAENCVDLGDLERARGYASEALEIAERIGARRTAAATRAVLSRVERTSGNDALATSLLISALTDHWDLQDIQFVSDHLAALGGLAGSLGDPRLGVTLVAAAHKARDELGITPTPVEAEQREQLLEPLRAALDARAFDQAWHEGSEAPLDEAVAEAKRLGALVARSANATDMAVAERTGLTPRQVEVLRLFAGGRSQAEIAEDLGLSLSMVTAQVGQIYNRLGIDSRAGLTAFAFKQGLV